MRKRNKVLLFGVAALALLGWLQLVRNLSGPDQEFFADLTERIIVAAANNDTTTASSLAYSIGTADQDAPGGILEAYGDEFDGGLEDLRVFVNVNGMSIESFATAGNENARLIVNLSYKDAGRNDTQLVLRFRLSPQVSKYYRGNPIQNPKVETLRVPYWGLESARNE